MAYIDTDNSGQISIHDLTPAQALIVAQAIVTYPPERSTVFLLMLVIDLNLAALNANPTSHLVKQIDNQNNYGQTKEK